MCEATQHNHFQGGWINSLSFHQFFSWSQLTDESKGGYLKGSIQVPIGITKIELALFARDGRNPHPNLLFVTHCRRYFSDDYKSPVFVDISLSKC